MTRKDCPCGHGHEPAHVLVEHDTEPAPEPSLSEQLRTARAELEHRQREHMQRWAELFVELARAIEHAARSEQGGPNASAERADALQHVEAAADIEYDLCGDCDALGKVAPADAREVTPP